MTSQKSFKARVRTRMEKTGESYTTARRHLINRTAEPASAAAPSAHRRPPAAAAQTERIADDLIRARTGRGWAEWFALLDAAAATEWTHTRIARHLVHRTRGAGLVGADHHRRVRAGRGLRAPGQRRGGGFEASASRTVAVPARDCSRRSPTRRHAPAGCPTSRYASAPPPRRAASGPTGPVAPPGSSSASTLSASRRPGSASCTRS